MDEKLLAEAKSLYQKLDFIIKAPSAKAAILQLTRNAFKSEYLDSVMYYDTVRFVTFVVGTDGILSLYQLDVINQICSKSLSQAELKKLTDIKGFSNSYASSTPLCTSILCALENMLYANDQADGLANVSLMNMLLDYFKAVGALLISNTDYFADLKRSLLKDALDTITNFARKNSLSPYFKR